VAIPDKIAEIQQILQQSKFSSGDSTSLEDLYNLLQTVQVNSILSTLQTIADNEYETLVVNRGQIPFASGRLTNILGELTQLHKLYTDNLITAYQTQYNGIQNLFSGFTARINAICDTESCTEELSSIITLIGTTSNSDIIIDTDGIDFENRTDEQITNAIKNKIPNTFSSFFHIKDVDIQCQDENNCTDTRIKYAKLTTSEFNNSTLTKEINDKIGTMFQSKNTDEPLKIPGLNLLTPDRPIDSPRYTTFQGINAQEIKFIYPDLYKVEVYKADSKGYQTLKTIPEIKTALQTYLQNKVNEYNTYLTEAKNNPISDSKANTKGAYTRLQNNFPKASPSLTSNVRPYNLFTYNDLLNALGGTSQLDTIAELLYYQNLTNTEKQSDNLIETDISNTRASFDINNKVKYTLQEYLIQGNKKSPLILPNYREKGYEVAYINSDGSDYIQNTQVPTFVAQAQQQQTDFDAKKVIPPEELSPTEQEIQEQCNIPIDGSVLLFDIQGTDKTPRLTAFKCRLEETKKTPIKVSLDFSESLGPVIFDETLFNTS
jgi:hypothetical protein